MTDAEWYAREKARRTLYHFLVLTVYVDGPGGTGGFFPGDRMAVAIRRVRTAAQPVQPKQTVQSRRIYLKGTNAKG